MRIGTPPLEPAPNPIKRPKLALFLWERGLRFRDVEKALGRSYEHIRQVCLPFADPARKIPDAALLARIETFTDGEVTKKDFEATSDSVASPDACDERVSA